MRGLRQLALWGGLLLAAPFFFCGGPTSVSSPIYPAIWNLGHILFFGLLAIGCSRGLANLVRGRQVVGVLVLSILVLVLGLMIEWVQAGVGRDPNWHDIWRNLLGAWGGRLLVNRRLAGTRTLKFKLLLFLALEVFLVVQVAWRVSSRENTLPLLYDFEVETEAEQWTGNVVLSHEVAAHGRASLMICLSTDKYSGTGSKSMPRDWRRYESLAFEVYNPGQEPITLGFMAADEVHELSGYRYGDRFNRKLLIAPGWNHFGFALADMVAAPTSREMDLSRMYRIGLFVSNLELDQVLFLDYVRLE